MFKKHEQKGLVNGYKDMITENFQVLIIALLLAVMVGVMAIMSQVADNNAFASEAGRIISRHGGITDAAIEEIDTYSDRMYKGRYEILTEDPTVYVYGTRIDYRIKGTYRWPFIQIPFNLEYESHTISKAKGVD